MENLGLVGLSDAGSNRLFSALTGLPDPGVFESAVAIAPVPDERVDRLSAMSLSKKIVHAGFELAHIALPPGAKPGEGLGTRFLGALRNCDAILFVLRAFEGASVGPPDAEGDLAGLELELVIADLATVEGRIDRQRRASKGDKSLLPEIAALERAHAVLSAGTPVYRSDLSADERALLAPCFLLTSKAHFVVVNISEDQIADADALAAPFGTDALAACIDVEAEIAACEPEERFEMLETFGIGESVVPRLARRAYELLNRRTFLTTGPDETRAWTFRAGARAPECAGVIHSDLQRGFIRAEAIDWEELLEIGSWAKAKELNRIRLEGKDYEVRDGDVLEIRFNV
ncbi:MAG: ribosome-binding ATPase [Actinomycetota bacterium]|nr:ribosome-binding ATPase [Actinomycetota bacterium]